MPSDRPAEALNTVSPFAVAFLMSSRSARCSCGSRSTRSSTAKSLNRRSSAGLRWNQMHPEVRIDLVAVIELDVTHVAAGDDLHRGGSV